MSGGVPASFRRIPCAPVLSFAELIMKENRDCNYYFHLYLCYPSNCVRCKSNPFSWGDLYPCYLILNHVIQDGQKLPLHMVLLPRYLPLFLLRERVRQRPPCSASLVPRTLRLGQEMTNRSRACTSRASHSFSTGHFSSCSARCPYQSFKGLGEVVYVVPDIFDSGRVVASHIIPTLHSHAIVTIAQSIDRKGCCRLRS